MADAFSTGGNAKLKDAGKKVAAANRLQDTKAKLKLKKRRKKLPEQKIVDKLQAKLRAACLDTKPSKFFRKFDKDKSGDLGAKELEKMIRTSLKISKSELSEKDVAALVQALDDDNSGSVSIEELGDFVEHGSATFYVDAEIAAEAWERDASPTRQKLKWGERADEATSAKADRKARLAKKLKPDFNEDTMKKLQGKLQAATFGADPLEIFRKFDTDGSGDLDEGELTRLIRLELKVASDDLPDDVIKAFMRAIDDDGDTVVNVGELADFVQFGMVTFYADAGETASQARALGVEGKLAWGERAADPVLDSRPGSGTHLGSLSAAQQILDDEEVVTIEDSWTERPQPVLKRPPSFVERDYADMEDEVRTLEARVAELKRRQQASRDTSHLTGVYHPPEKAISEDALYVDALLADAELQLDDCGVAPALEAFRASIAAEHPNDLAAATALLKIGAMLRDVAEGRAYTLKTASEAQRRALHRAVSGLSKDHAVALAARRDLGATLALMGEAQQARAEYQAVLAVLEAREPPPPPSVVEEARRLLLAVGGGGD